MASAFERFVNSGWRRRLDVALAELEPGDEIDPIRLSRQVRPPTVVALANEMTRRALSGEIDMIYRVLSPEAKGTVADFSAKEAVPPSVEDHYTGKEIWVDPDKNVEIVFRPIADSG